MKEEGYKGIKLDGLIEVLWFRAEGARKGMIAEMFEVKVRMCAEQMG